MSDIDDAPIVTAEDNKELLASNVLKKEKLKVAKANLAETQQNIRTLAPLVEEGTSTSTTLNLSPNPVNPLIHRLP